MKPLQNYPLYSIGVVSELLGVHPETIRLWEKAGIAQPPQRRSGKRFYSEKDYKRLQFVHTLAQEGLTVRAMLYYLRLYPCWKTMECASCLHSSARNASTKPCWQESGTYCQVANNENPCTSCKSSMGEEKPLDKRVDVGKAELEQSAQEAESNPFTKIHRKR
ncbi:MerR family transcriptional regulator [Chloroflexota bacterium]